MTRSASTFVEQSVVDDLSATLCIRSSASNEETGCSARLRCLSRQPRVPITAALAFSVRRRRANASRYARRPRSAPKQPRAELAQWYDVGPVAGGELKLSRASRRGRLVRCGIKSGRTSPTDDERHSKGGQTQPVDSLQVSQLAAGPGPSPCRTPPTAAINSKPASESAGGSLMSAALREWQQRWSFACSRGSVLHGRGSSR